MCCLHLQTSEIIDNHNHINVGRVHVKIPYIFVCISPACTYVYMKCSSQILAMHGFKFPLYEPYCLLSQIFALQKGEEQHLLQYVNI